MFANLEIHRTGKKGSVNFVGELKPSSPILLAFRLGARLHGGAIRLTKLERKVNRFGFVNPMQPSVNPMQPSVNRLST